VEFPQEEILPEIATEVQRIRLLLIGLSRDGCQWHLSFSTTSEDFHLAIVAGGRATLSRAVLQWKTPLMEDTSDAITVICDRIRKTQP
jgi:hypothetical protein